MRSHPTRGEAAVRMGHPAFVGVGDESPTYQTRPKSNRRSFDFAALRSG